MKTPGQILFESQGSSRLEWSALDERVRKQFESEGAAVWNAAIEAALGSLWFVGKPAEVEQIARSNAERLRALKVSL
jgi:hypothetical protein